MNVGPELTWRLLLFVFWGLVAWDVCAHFTDRHATISSVLYDKAQDNWMIPVVLAGLWIHVFGGVLPKHLR